MIDDGSTDATAAVAAAHGALVVSFGENRGLRAGIAAGYREAHDRGYGFCGRVDADGQHPVDELRRLLELVRSDRCDVAVGSRFAEGEGYGADRYEPSAARRFGIGLLQKAMHVRLGRPFHDPTSGMAAVNRKAMPVMARPYVSGAPEVEALLRLKEAGLRVEEVAVHMRERAHGESKLQGREGGQARAHRGRDAALLPLAATPPVVSRRGAQRGRARHVATSDTAMAAAYGTGGSTRRSHAGSGAREAPLDAKCVPGTKPRPIGTRP